MRPITLLSIATNVLMPVLMADPVVVDRIAVIVGKHVIKSSDIERDLRVTAFLNREQVQSSAETRRSAAERLIDQQIIRQEVANGGYRSVSDEDALALVDKIKQERFGGTDVGLRASLSEYGLTVDKLVAHVRWQLTVLRFIEQRFRLGVLITDEDVRTYYDQHVAELARQDPASTGMEAWAEKIRASLEGERINRDFEAWIAQARKRARIEYIEEALK